METTLTITERIDDQVARFILDKGLQERGDVTPVDVDEFDRRLREVLGAEEIAANLKLVQEVIDTLPLEVQLHQIETQDLREQHLQEVILQKIDLTFYQIPRNEELRAKLAAFGLAEEETRRVLKANKTQREKLLRQYFDEKVDALVATYQRSTNTEVGTKVIIDKIDALAEILGKRYEEKAAIARHRIHEIAEDREVVEYKAKVTTPQRRIAPRLKQGAEEVKRSLQKYAPNLYAELQIPEILRNPTPFQRYEIRKPGYFRKPQKGFRIEDPVPTIGLLEYTANKPIETEVQEAPARSRFIERKPSLTVDDATIDRYLARQNETGFVLIGEPYIIQNVESIEVETQAPKAKKINSAQKFVDKIRARRAEKEAAIAREAEATYERPAANVLYTPMLTRLALGMSPSVYETRQPEEQTAEAYSITVPVPEVPTIIMAEATIVREARDASLANVNRILSEVKAQGQRALETRAKEVAAFGEFGADFFTSYNPETAEMRTTPVVIERVESNEVLENRVRRANRLSQIKGAITAVATVAAAVTALVGGLGYFARISNEAVQAMYNSLKPETSIVETVLQEYGKTLEREEVKPVYTPEAKEIPSTAIAPKAKQQVYVPSQAARTYETGTEEQTSNIGVKASTQGRDDIKVKITRPDISYTPIVTGYADIQVKRPAERESGLSSKTTKEIIQLYEAQRTATTQYIVPIDPWEMAAKRAEIEAFKERRENWQSAQALLKQYDAILANPSAYQVE